MNKMLDARTAKKGSRRSERTVKKMGTVKLIGVALLVSVMASMIVSEAQSSPDAKTLGPGQHWRNP
jgi:hypothetical protein